MNNFKEKFIGFVKARGVGFWLLLPATVFSIVLPFVYLSAYVSQLFRGGSDDNPVLCGSRIRYVLFQIYG